MALFKEGQSGNPSGRPKGIVDKRTQLRNNFESESKEIVSVVIQAAKDGDMQACKMVLDRISPPLKSQAATITIDKPLPKHISETARVFIEAAASGQLPPDIASQLVSSVGTLARVIEIDELKERLESLERSLQDKKL